LSAYNVNVDIQKFPFHRRTRRDTMITLEMYKDQIDAYFDNTPPSEIIKRFEALGYEFVPIDTPDFDDTNFVCASINGEPIGQDACAFNYQK